MTWSVEHDLIGVILKTHAAGQGENPALGTLG